MNLINPVLKKSLLGALLAFGTLGLGIGNLQADEGSAVEEVPAGAKLIRVRSTGDAGSSSKLHVSMRADASSYRVNESIRFRVKGNRDFFLYVFNVNPTTGKGVVILPNRYQTRHRIKYTGGSWHSVPNSNVEFYSDRPGKERIILLASEKYLDVDRLLRRRGTKALGDFYAIDDPLDAVDEMLSEGFADEGTKTIRVRSGNSRLPRGLVMKEVNLRIR